MEDVFGSTDPIPSLHRFFVRDRGKLYRTEHYDICPLIEKGNELNLWKWFQRSLELRSTWIDENGYLCCPGFGKYARTLHKQIALQPWKALRQKEKEVVGFLYTQQLNGKKNKYLEILKIKKAVSALESQVKNYQRDEQSRLHAALLAHRVRQPKMTVV